jgi:hypothetical protein
MLSAKVSSSLKACPQEAGKEVALKVKQDTNNIKVAFVYSSVKYNQEELLNAISKELVDVPLIGNTSFTGIITPEGFISSEDGFVGIMAISDDELTVGVSGMAKNDCARATGREVAKEALRNAGKNIAPDYFYMVATPGEEELYLKGIEDVIGRVPFFGGSAADNSITGEWQLFTDKVSFSNGVAVAFFYTNKPFASKFTGAYHETSKSGIITKIEGKRTLVEIDGIPALKKFAEWTGVEADSLQGGKLLAASVTSPLGVKDRLGDLVAIRHPMNGNEDYSMNIGNNLSTNTAVILVEATVDELIESTGTTVKNLTEKLGNSAGALHLVHCGGRRAAIADRIDEVASQIKAAAGDIPFIVEFTFGEYGYEDDGNNTCGGLMLSFTAFSK